MPLQLICSLLSKSSQKMNKFQSKTSPNKMQSPSERLLFKEKSTKMQAKISNLSRPTRNLATLLCKYTLRKKRSRKLKLATSGTLTPKMDQMISRTKLLLLTIKAN